MKKVVCLILLLGSFATLSAQTFTAEMKRAGMMWYFADYQNADQARKIKVVGDINGDDIRVLRQLAGGKYGKELDEPDRGCLEELDLSEVAFADKWTHMVMYGGTASVMWWEHLRRHRRPSWLRLLLFAGVGLIVLGGVMELFQAYCTATRAG